METLNSSINSIQNVSKRNDLLKLIAMVTMLIDHIGLLFYPELLIFRTIGRIAFPIFAYQLAVGYQKTHNRVSYVKRLFIFAIISQVPYVFLNQNMELNLFHFNVIFLFLYGIFVLLLFDKCSYSFNKLKFKLKIDNLVLWFLLSLSLIVVVFLPMVLEIMFPWFVFSYSSYGILMILIFHMFRKKPAKILISYILISLLTPYLKGGVYIISNYQNSFVRLQTYGVNITEKSDVILQNILSWKGGLTSLSGYFFQLRSLLGLFTIAILETLNPRFKLNKYLGYWFYPLHITILLSIKLFLS